MRIVSLVPAGTDILCALGLGSDVVGISHECDHPADVAPPRLTRSMVETGSLSSAEIDAAVAGQVAAGAPLYEIDAEQLAALRPDLILTQGLCDVCALPARAVRQALDCLTSRPAILSLDARSIDGVLDSIRQIGVLAGCERDAEDLINRLIRRWSSLVAC